MAMTPREASAGIGQRVTDTESGEIGRLHGVKPRSHYHVGVVAFSREVREVWLRNLSWTDGLKTSHTIRLPYGEFLDFFHHASSGELRGNAEMRKRLFKRLFGRDPTANERQYMAGKGEGGVCGRCHARQSLAVNPNGSVESECACQMVASAGRV
jgi:hypothetical protein